MVYDLQIIEVVNRLLPVVREVEIVQRVRVAPAAVLTRRRLRIHSL